MLFSWKYFDKSDIAQKYGTPEGNQIAMFDTN